MNRLVAVSCFLLLSAAEAQTCRAGQQARCEPTADCRSVHKECIDAQPNYWGPCDCDTDIIHGNPAMPWRGHENPDDLSTWTSQPISHRTRLGVVLHEMGMSWDEIDVNCRLVSRGGIRGVDLFVQCQSQDLNARLLWQELQEQFERWPYVIWRELFPQCETTEGSEYAPWVCTPITEYP